MLAVTTFLEKMKIVEAMIDQELSCDPSKPDERPLVLGLRGGAAVLMVAAFEKFLKEVFNDYISFLDTDPPIDWTRPLPDRTRTWNIYENLRLASGHHQKVKKNKLIADIPTVRDVCVKLSKNLVVADAFSRMKSNPNVNIVRGMFQKVDIDNVFQEIHNEFAENYGPIPKLLYIETELDRIVERRHYVAHTADATQFTGIDLNDDIRILLSLTKALDIKLKYQIDKLIAEYSNLGMPSYSDLTSLFG